MDLHEAVLSYVYTVTNAADRQRVDAIEETLARAGWPLGDHYAALGSGMFGNAYLFDGQLVLKLTSDPQEAQASKNLQAQPAAATARIGEVHRLLGSRMQNWRLPTPTDTYLITMEYIPNRLPAILRPLLNQHVRAVKAAHRVDSHDLLSISRAEALVRLKAATEDLRDRLRASAEAYFTELAEAVEALRARGIYTVDLHYDNVGLRDDGSLAAYDLGLSVSPRRTIPERNPGWYNETDVEPLGGRGWPEAHLVERPVTIEDLV